MSKCCTNFPPAVKKAIINRGGLTRGKTLQAVGSDYL